MKKVAAGLMVAAVAIGAALAAAPQEPAEPPGQQPAEQPQEAPPEQPVEPVKEDAAFYYQRGMAAHLRKDNIAYLENMQKAAQLAPNSPAILYRFAAASALIGNSQDALDQLKRLVEMKVAPDVSGNTDFDSLHGNATFQTILAEMRKLKAPVGSSVVAFRLAQKDLIVDGIAHDPVTEDFFLGSVHRRKIVRSSKKGKATDLTAEKQDGLGAVLGLKVDPTRRLLWACSSGVPQMKEALPEELGRGALFRIDLGGSGAIKGYAVAAGAPGHSCNDLTLNARGDVFVSDSEASEIHMLAAGGEELKLFLDAPEISSPQGLAFTPDEKTLFVAGYTSGLFRVDMASLAVTPVAASTGDVVSGIDGLLYHDGGLVAIQNGITPHRLVRFTLTPALDRVERSRILEMNNPLFDAPTLGVLAGDNFFYVANSQWGSFYEGGAIYPSNRLAETAILKTKLK